MGTASGGSNTPHWIRNNILDFLRVMFVKIAVENGWKLVNVSPQNIRNRLKLGCNECFGNLAIR